MHRSRPALLLAVTGLLACFLGYRALELGSLRASAAALRESAAAVAALREANTKLQAARPPAHELANLREEAAAIARLRNEVEAIRRGVAARENPSTPPAPTRAPTLLEARLATAQWRDVGRDTPAAAVETLLWAAAAGEVERLAETMALGPDTLAKAKALFSSLSPDLRQEHVSPERLMALITAGEIPLGHAQVVAEVPNQHGTVLMTNLEDANGRSRVVALSLHPDGPAWRVELPPAAVDRYAAKLRNPTVAVQLSAVQAR